MAGYKTKIYSLHQKGTSVSGKSVPRLNMTLAWWDVLTQTQQQHKNGLYIHAFI